MHLSLDAQVPSARGTLPSASLPRCCSSAPSVELLIVHSVEGNSNPGQQGSPAHLPWNSSRASLKGFGLTGHPKTKAMAASSLSAVGYSHTNPIVATTQNACWVQEELTVNFLEGEEGTEIRGFGRKRILIDQEICTEGGMENRGSEILYVAHEEESMEDAEVTDVSGDACRNVIDRFVALMKDCVEQRDLNRASRIHADLIKIGLLQKNLVVGNTLVSMYAKCGALKKAEEVFESLPAWSTVSWNVLLATYIKHGHNEKARRHFERMQLEGFQPNEVTFTCILKVCSSLGDLDMGQASHALMVRDGILEINVHASTALLDMYAKCGLLQKAQEIFDNLPARNIISWTALIIGYAQYDQGEEAFHCFEQMQLEGFIPDAYIFSCTLKACCNTGNLDRGQQIHAWVIKESLLEKNIVVTSSLVDMYAKCGALEKAHSVFDMLSFHDRISWTALINGYALHGHGEKALLCYEQMQFQGFSANEVTFSGLLKACCRVGAAEAGQKIHAEIIKEGLLGRDLHLGTALVDMYAKCGIIAKAGDVFNNLGVRDVATWTALITVYVQNEQFDEAWFLFEQMKIEGIFPDAVTFSCMMTACGSVAAINKGQKVHMEVIKLGLIEEDMVVGTALVDMYAKCGMIMEAQGVFDKLQGRDLVSWCTLMVGYAQLGKEKPVFELLDKMLEEGKQPNIATFTIVLNTCNHMGLLDEGHFYFELFSKDYDISPVVEQHTCMIDLFGRAGNLDKAVALIMEMWTAASLTLWTTLLSACLRWGNIKLGRWAYDQALQTDKKDGAAYICMNNIYVAAEYADSVEAMLPEKQGWTLDEGASFFME